jgi:polysaccharide pyruvyl transferase WcaK-like protein
MSTESHRVVVLHGYSRLNTGDGLLVDLTLEALQRAGVAGEECVVVVSDPPSFCDLPHTHPVPLVSALRERSVPEGSRLFADLWNGFIGSRIRPLDGSFADIVKTASLVVGVGGGYFRAGRDMGAAKMRLTHLPQLLAARTAEQSIYMPQSVGPLKGGDGRDVRSALARVGVLFVRDDRTVEELGVAANVRRMPDLAVLKLAQKMPTPIACDPSAPTVLAIRDLPHGAGYYDRIAALARELNECVFAAQSVGRGNDDRRFVEQRLHVPAPMRLASALEANDRSVVVSVRLHGALAAILAGHPAIHLAYERKGWGAYQDLGLESFVHSAYRFDPHAVAEQARSLAHDAGDFWARIGAKKVELLARRNDLDAAIRTSLAAA